MRKLSGQAMYLAAILIGSALLVGYVAVDFSREFSAGSQTRATAQTREKSAQTGQSAARQRAREAQQLKRIPFDGAQAYEYLRQICDLGPRRSGSAAMRSQQQLLTEHFEGLAGTVQLHSFKVRHPLDGSAVPMANLMVTWHPDRAERILVCAHYDTRPYPDQDRYRPRGRFIGANDGASGVALLMELARHMPDLPGAVGVDFILFDGEELVYDEVGEYFLGSTHFARRYAANPPQHRYRYAVLLDMIGDADLQVHQEVNSVRWRETRPLVESIWNTARRLGVREFVARPRHEVRDDHLPLRNIAKIPACDVIDFDYPYWHTEGDVPERCSALSLAKVGWVIHEWLKTAVQP